MKKLPITYPINHKYIKCLVNYSSPISYERHVFNKYNIYYDKLA